MNGSDKESDYDFSPDNWSKPTDENASSQGNNIKNSCAVNDNVHFKILVPSIAAGAIIGKGGEAIAQIQKETGAKVKMSKANDFYPGTTERVCLILGTVDSITRMHNYIMEKILEKADTNTKNQSDNRMLGERHKQVKILVPNSTAGMIIGKGGAFIKEIKEASGAFIQISQKSREINLPERCIVIAGELEHNRKATGAILAKIAEDPQSASCPSISYADSQGPVASAYPTGSPYANSSPPHSGGGGPIGGLGSGGGGVGSLTGGPVGSSSSVVYSPIGVQLANLTHLGQSTSSPPPHHLSPPHHQQQHHHQQQLLQHQQQQQAIAAAAAAAGFGPPPPHIIGSPLLAAAASAQMVGSGSTPQQQQSTGSSGGSSSSYRGGGGNCNAILQCTGSGSSSGLNMDSLRAALHYAGYPDSASQEIAAAMQVLDKYGFINTSSVLSSGGNNSGGGPSNCGGLGGGGGGSGMGGGIGSQGPVSSPSLAAAISAFPNAATGPHTHFHTFSGPPSGPGTFQAAYGASPPSFGSAATMLSPGSSYNFGQASLFHSFGPGPPSSGNPNSSQHHHSSGLSTGPGGPTTGTGEDFFLMSSPPEFTTFPLYSPPLQPQHQHHQSGTSSNNNPGGLGGGGGGAGGPGNTSDYGFIMSPAHQIHHQPPFIEQAIELPESFPFHLLEEVLNQCEVYLKSRNTNTGTYVLQGLEWNIAHALALLSDKQLAHQQQRSNIVAATISSVTSSSSLSSTQITSTNINNNTSSTPVPVATSVVSLVTSAMTTDASTGSSTLTSSTCASNATSSSNNNNNSNVNNNGTNGNSNSTSGSINNNQ